MSDDTTANKQMLAQMQDDLQELARLLRETRHLEPQAQCELASLLEELGSELNPAEFNSTHITHLAETVSRLARSLHEQQHSGLLTASRKPPSQPKLRPRWPPASSAASLMFWAASESDGLIRFAASLPRDGGVA